MVTQEARAIDSAAPLGAQPRLGANAVDAMDWYRATRNTGVNAACQSFATNTGADVKRCRARRSKPRRGSPPKNNSSQGTQSNDSIAASDTNANRK
jgi:hypothetical protein